MEIPFEEIPHDLNEGLHDYSVTLFGYRTSRLSHSLWTDSTHSPRGWSPKASINSC